MGKFGAGFSEWSRMGMSHSGNEKPDFILEWVILTAGLKNGRVLAAQHTNWQAKNKTIIKCFQFGTPNKAFARFGSPDFQNGNGNENEGFWGRKTRMRPE